MAVSSASSHSLTFDSNGNMTNDGTNSYSWDAENRLIKITYPGTGNNSQFAYDGLGRRVQILEYTSSSLTSTKNFVWCGGDICEERNSGGSVTRQFFGYGETISGSSYYYNSDHLGSTREMTNSSGSIVWQQSFDPYGVPTTIVSTTPADFGYAGMYAHSRSGLNLTRTRAYSAGLGRFISRDPIGENGDVNLYAYVENNSVSYRDPSGRVGVGVLALPFVANPLALAGIITVTGLVAGVGGIWHAGQEIGKSWQILMNSSNEIEGNSIEDLSESGKALDPADKCGKLSKAGRALAKHNPAKGGKRADEPYPPATGTPEQINDQGQQILDDILNDPNKTVLKNPNGSFEVQSGNQGARFDPAGNFTGFLKFP